MTNKLILWREEQPNANHPMCWVNFCNQTIDNNEKPVMTLFDILEEYHARYTFGDTATYIEFEDERYYSMFVLRYS